MPKPRIFTMPFAKVYPLYVQKAERKQRTQAEVDQIICWLTGYNSASLQQQIAQEHDFETFFCASPRSAPQSCVDQGCGMWATPGSERRVF